MSEHNDESKTPYPYGPKCKLHEAQLNQLLQDIAEIKMLQFEMKSAIMGTSLGGSGLIQKVNEHDSSISHLLDIEGRVKGAFWAFGIAGGIIGVLSTILINHII